MKTRKRREKTQMSSLIQPNSLKKELLNRIKHHKHKEQTDYSSSLKAKKEEPFLDEFMDSIQYLNMLSLETKKEPVKATSFAPVVPTTSFAPTISFEREPFVSLELPESLQLPRKDKLDVPYGCLKGGSKPTYRNWKKNTQKNTFIHIPDNIAIETASSERERRLESLKERTKRTKENEDMEIKMREEPLLLFPEKEKEKEREGEKEKEGEKIPESLKREESIEQGEKNELKELLEPKKKFIKTTKKTKYNLGKSKTLRKVGVLIKDRATRKQIISAQKDLKKEALRDVKKYLRQHGLLKVGSNAPNDVIRKIYETTMLTGDITNENKDVLVHNFINETE